MRPRGRIINCCPVPWLDSFICMVLLGRMQVLKQKELRSLTRLKGTNVRIDDNDTIADAAAAAES